jgi:endoglucanase
MRIINAGLIVGTIVQFCLGASVQSMGKFTVEDYKRALWMTTRFYGAQKSGLGPNWLLMEHTPPEYRTSFTHDADATSNNYDLEGGWFDCGDHVLFGQTFFFSAYFLAKAYSMFPCGFHDLYNGISYSDYMASGNWDIDGGGPDGIPDLLEELKYATDWMIKATPDASTFYYQKGEGAKDHKCWVTAGKMSTLSADSGGEPRNMFKNPNDGVMASYAAATLAIMSRAYKRFDPDYAQHCLEHAKNAYNYAKPRKNNAAGAGDGGYYVAHANPPVVAFIVAASEMFKATGETFYKTDAQAEQNQIKFHNWGLDYNNLATPLSLPRRKPCSSTHIPNPSTAKAYVRVAIPDGERSDTLQTPPV